MKSPASLPTVVLPTLLLVACSFAAQPTTTPSTAVSISPTPVAVLTPGLPASQTAAATPACPPTLGDELSPSYKSDAPVRSAVGQGHIVTGVVRSSANCAPIPDVKLEFWSEAPGLGHPDEYRATLFTDSAGAYRFECNPTDHIHMRISAEGYHDIASNAYHTEGRPEGIFDIVLEPDKP